MNIKESVPPKFQSQLAHFNTAKSYVIDDGQRKDGRMLKSSRHTENHINLVEIKNKRASLKSNSNSHLSLAKTTMGGSIKTMKRIIVPLQQESRNLVHSNLLVDPNLMHEIDTFRQQDWLQKQYYASCSNHPPMKPGGRLGHHKRSSS